MSSESAKPGLSMLRRIELETLYGVGEILSRTLDFRHTLREVLRALDELAGMSRSMVTVVDPENGDLVVHAVSVQDESEHASVRYQPGEGLLGLILAEQRTIALPRTGDEPRFLNRLGVFDKRLPFIAAVAVLPAASVDCRRVSAERDATSFAACEGHDRVRSPGIGRSARKRPNEDWEPQRREHESERGNAKREADHCSLSMTPMLRKQLAPGTPSAARKQSLDRRS